VEARALEGSLRLSAARKHLSCNPATASLSFAPARPLAPIPVGGPRRRGRRCRRGRRGRLQLGWRRDERRRRSRSHRSARLGPSISWGKDVALAILVGPEFNQLLVEELRRQGQSDGEIATREAREPEPGPAQAVVEAALRRNRDSGMEEPGAEGSGFVGAGLKLIHPPPGSTHPDFPPGEQGSSDVGRGAPPPGQRLGDGPRAP
jgi:hypothetical protein